MFGNDVWPPKEPMDWEAVATFAAVLAAFVVGALQMRILHRQANIQATTLRHELFDKRLEVYNTTLAAIDAGLAASVVSTQAWHVIEGFKEAVNRSLFLFSDELMMKLHNTEEAILRYRNVEDDQWDRYTQTQQQLLRTEQHELREWLNLRKRTLPYTFCNEGMRLGERYLFPEPEMPPLPPSVKTKAHPDHAAFWKEWEKGEYARDFGYAQEADADDKRTDMRD